MWFWKISIGWRLFVLFVTNSYLGSIPVSNEPHQVSEEGRSHLISRGDSSCSWVLVRALDPVYHKELQAIMLVRRWNVDGEPDGSSTFAVDVKLVLPSGTRSLWRIQTLSLSTAFIVTPGTGWLLHKMRRWCPSSRTHSLSLNYSKQLIQPWFVARRWISESFTVHSINNTNGW